jgi:3-oxoacyl-[acyl-carrier-protein] synthase-3
MTGAERRQEAGRPGSAILGLGVYRPARVVGNAEVCRRIDSSDEWIRRRSGIVSRRFAGPEETVVAMASAAAAKAVARAGVLPSEVDMVLLASMSYLHQSPAAAPQVAAAIGARAAAAMDLHAACAGFCYALATADALVRGAAARHVLVVGSERMTDIVDPCDRGTAFLFGDGAGAMLVGPSQIPGIHPVSWGSDGERHDVIAHSGTWPPVTVPRSAPAPHLRMDGPAVFRWAVQQVPCTARTALDNAQVSPGELAAFIPHQANARITAALAKALALPPSVAIADDIATAGNTSAASIPLAMDALLTKGTVPSGGLALLAGFGAGLAHAAMVVNLP